MKKLGLLVVVAVAVGALWSWRRAGAPAESTELDRRLIADRIWIDHVPRNERDTIQVFAAISEHAVGLFQATSQWRGSYEAFRYEAGAGELRLVFPQTGKRETAKVRARRCSEGGMDFCLDLDGTSHGVKRYYSREGWEIRGGRDVAEDVAAIDRELDTLRGRLVD